MRTKAPTRSNHMDDQPLKGQKALVTGASSGIGEGVARALGAAGAAVVVNYVAKPEAAAKIVEEIRGNGVDAVAIRGDVSKELEVEAMFAEMERTWGGIDILVNNAGLQRDAPVRSEEHTSELQSQSNLVCRLLLEKKKKNMKPQQSSKDKDNR